MENEIGSFQLGIVNYRIINDPARCQKAGYTYVGYSGSDIVYITSQLDGEDLDNNVIEYNIFKNIVFHILAIMEEIKMVKNERFINPLASYLLHFYKTYTGPISPGLFDGDFYLAGNHWIVKTDPSLNCSGQCNPLTQIISLNSHHPDDITYSTLIHELMHAINYTIGREHQRINSEKFVNTFSTLMSQALKNLRITLKSL